MENFKKKIIIKLGRSIVTNEDNNLNIELFTQLARQIKELQSRNFGVILVVSGAVIIGKKRFNNLSLNLHKGLLASLGQITLSCEIDSIFSDVDLMTGQVLFTKSDFDDKVKIKQLKEIVNEAFKNNIILVFNENDAVELNTFYGNDFLASKLAQVINANNLILLTDVEGVMDKNMHVLNNLKKSEINHIANIKKQNSKGQIGGMKAKIQAALKARKSGIESIIAHGKTEDILTRLFINKENIGTEIL